MMHETEGFSVSRHAMYIVRSRAVGSQDSALRVSLSGSAGTHGDSISNM